MASDETKGAYRRITLTAGHDKQGRPEDHNLVFQAGQITALVGPTGSGKSRLLADIESLADGDTPSGRRLLVEDRPLDADQRFALQGRLVAQLTQNMHFVLDMEAGRFLRTHAQSRGIAGDAAAAARVLAAANELAGEPFAATTQLTQLSGGQSRALMIADTALLSSSPILLIDEIENAGIDKRKALDLLLHSEKIILIATHDPVLALAADRRLVFARGAVQAIHPRRPEEAPLLQRLMALEETLARAQRLVRIGGHLELAAIAHPRPTDNSP